MGNKNEPIRLNGKVNMNKDGEGKKFLKIFFAGSFVDAIKYAFTNVMVPYTKDIICKTSTNVINFWVNGDKPTLSNTSGPNRVSYWNGPGVQRPSYANPQPPKSNSIYDVGQLCFDDRGDAEAVLLKMRENLAVYKTVSVGDLYDLSGYKVSFTDYKYGWRNLDSAKILRTTDGKYVIDLPKVSPIE